MKARKFETRIFLNYVLFALITLLIAVPLFYFLTDQIYLSNVNKVLIDNEKIITKQYNLQDQAEMWTHFNLLVKKEGEHYVPFIGIILFISSLILLSILFLINRRLVRHFGRDLDSMIEKIMKFEVSQNVPPSFNRSSITELNDMARHMVIRTQGNIDIYNTQKEFVENAAHELQTPLSVIQAKIDLLMQDPDLTEKHLNTMIVLHDSIARLNRMNKNLLLLSKIDHDVYKNVETFVLNDIIKDQLAFFEEQMLSKHLELILQLEYKINITCNINLLEVVIRNLFMNAIQHNHENGKIIISISTGRILTFANSGEEEIKDNEKLFTRFYKFDTSTPGSGLGLPLVKKIIDLYKWPIKYHFKDALHYFEIWV